METPAKPDRRAAANPAANAAAPNRAAANRTTALILASIAVVFFFGVIAAQMIGTPTVSIAVIGSAVLLYLLVAIGRNLRK